MSKEKSNVVSKSAGARKGVQRVRRKLSATQNLALDALVAGNSISVAANTAGVDRRTLHRWIKTHPRFAAAFNAWQQEVIDSGRARVLAMTDKALDTVQAAVEKGDARIALQVARATGVLTLKPPGAAEPNLFERRYKLRAARGELDLTKAEQQLRKERGDDNDDWTKDIGRLERLIEFYLHLRQKAMDAETPEERSKRRAAYQTSTSRIIDLLQEWDERDTPYWTPTNMNTRKRPADYDSVRRALWTATPRHLRPDITIPPEPVPPPPPAPPSPIRPQSKCADAAAPQKLAPPVRMVHADGSDEDDNDPQWKRIQ